MDAHRPVLLEELIHALVPQPGGIYVDATLGRGGHSARLLECIGSEGSLYALDRDPAAVAAGRARFADDRRVRIEQAPFSRLDKAFAGAGLAGRVDGMMLDLGVSSPQLDTPERGFSFLRDGPLDMRMDPGSGQSAADWLAQATDREIADVIFHYGEERRSRRVAAAIVAAREEAPINSTAQLARIVSDALPSGPSRRHPATRVFQAIRMHVNRELDELDAVLAHSLSLLASGGRIAVISFHSLEDRRVKRFLRNHSRVDPALARLPVVPQDARPDMRLVGGARRATPEEVAANPRARSAVLRVGERLS